MARRVVTDIIGLDGKTYPARRVSDDEQQALVSAVHGMRHERGLSVRAIQTELADHGVRRSVGWVSTALSTWRCDGCSGGRNDSPEQ